jgi:cation transport ATPase
VCRNFIHAVVGNVGIPTFEGWTLWIHIAAGTVAVLAGLGALVTSKGGGWRHRQAGKLFLVSMGVVVATVFGLLAINPTTFRIILALIAIFSGYFAFSGYRIFSRKRPADDADAIDWAATVAVFLTSGDSAEAHGFSRGRKRASSVQQPTSIGIADSPSILKNSNKE